MEKKHCRAGCSIVNWNQVYPNPDSCHQFYKCANGTLTLETCGNGLLFNEVLVVLILTWAVIRLTLEKIRLRGGFFARQLVWLDPLQTTAVTTGKRNVENGEKIPKTEIQKKTSNTNQKLKKEDEMKEIEINKSTPKVCGRHPHLKPWLWIPVWDLPKWKRLLRLLHKVCQRGSLGGFLSILHVLLSNRWYYREECNIHRYIYRRFRMFYFQTGGIIKDAATRFTASWVLPTTTGSTLAIGQTCSWNMLVRLSLTLKLNNAWQFCFGRNRDSSRIVFFCRVWPWCCSGRL